MALVLALPPDDRCGVMIIIGHIWFQWSRLKVSPPHSMVEHGWVRPSGSLFVTARRGVPIFLPTHLQSNKEAAIL